MDVPLHPLCCGVPKDAKCSPYMAVSELWIVIMESAVHQKCAAQSKVYIGMIATVLLVWAEVTGTPGIYPVQQAVKTREDCLLEDAPLRWPLAVAPFRCDELPAQYKVQSDAPT